MALVIGPIAVASQSAWRTLHFSETRYMHIFGKLSGRQWPHGERTSLVQVRESMRRPQAAWPGHGSNRVSTRLLGRSDASWLEGLGPKIAGIEQVWWTHQPARIVEEIPSQFCTDGGSALPGQPATFATE